jgi:hypothetical protein
LKNLMALALSFFILSAHANIGTQGSLKMAFDELNYALTVEWDQKDKDFYQKEVNSFNKKINQLRSEGMTNQEFLDFMISNIQDEVAANDLKQFYALASAQKLSQIEIESMSRELINRHYARGADWIGTVMLIGAGAIVLIVGITALVVWDLQRNQDNCGYDYVCQTDNTCYTYYNCN